MNEKKTLHQCSICGFECPINSETIAITQTIKDCPNPSHVQHQMKPVTSSKKQKKQ